MISRHSILLVAGTICGLVSLGGLILVGAVGIVAGPLVDQFITPRLIGLTGRRYASPGAPLWAASFAGLALIAATSITPRSPSNGLALTGVVAVPGMVLSILALWRPLARLGAVSLGLCVAALIVAYVLYRTHRA